MSEPRGRALGGAGSEGAHFTFALIAECGRAWTPESPWFPVGDRPLDLSLSLWTLQLLGGSLGVGVGVEHSRLQAQSLDLRDPAAGQGNGPDRVAFDISTYSPGNSVREMNPLGMASPQLGLSGPPPHTRLGAGSQD